MVAFVVVRFLVVMIISVTVSITVVTALAVVEGCSRVVDGNAAVVACTVVEAEVAGGASAFFAPAHAVTAESISTARAADTILFFILFSPLYYCIKAENCCEFFILCRDFKGAALKLRKALCNGKTKTVALGVP